jgi:hypothetical protein
VLVDQLGLRGMLLGRKCKIFSKETAIEYGLLASSETGNNAASVRKARAAVKKALSKMEARIEKIGSGC